MKQNINFQQLILFGSRYIKNILAVFLACLLLITNMGFTLATHYCGGKAIKTQIVLDKSEFSCEAKETASKMVCDEDSQKSLLKTKSCCQNEYVLIEVEENYHAPVVETIPVNFVTLFACTVGLHKTFLRQGSSKAIYQNHPPPLLNFDIPVWIQSFLL